MCGNYVQRMDLSPSVRHLKLHVVAEFLQCACKMTVFSDDKTINRSSTELARLDLFFSQLLS